MMDLVRVQINGNYVACGHIQDGKATKIATILVSIGDDKLMHVCTHDGSIYAVYCVRADWTKVGRLAAKKCCAVCQRHISTARIAAWQAYMHAAYHTPFSGAGLQQTFIARERN